MTRYCGGCGRVFTPEREHHRLCWACWRRRPGTRTSTFVAAAPPRLDPELIRGAVTLTHPDRHPPARAELANRVTAYLLELLELERFERRAA